MKIAFIDFVLDPALPGASGLSDIVWNTARELARLGDEVHIVAPYSVDPPPVLGVTVHRFKLPPVGYRNILGHILIVLAAWRVVRRIPNVDVIHAPEYLSTGIIAPLSRVPVMLVTPGNIYERIANGNPFDPITTQVLKLAARSSARWCALIDAISNEMAMWWGRTGASDSRIVQIPYGVDTTVFRRVRDARAELGISDSTPTILHAGRLSPEKHVEMLIRALPKLSQRDVELHLVGEGAQQQTLSRLVDELGIGERVHFHGQVALADMPKWYSAANVVALPSSSEGLPRVMLEALACSAPFVGTRITGVVDVIRDGENGILIEPGDLAGLETALQRLLNDQEFATRLGTHAASDVRSTLSWTSVVGRVRSAIESSILNTTGTAMGSVADD